MSLTVNTDPKIYEGKWEEFQPGVTALIIPYTRKIMRRVMAEATVIPPPVDGVEQEGKVDPDLWDQNLYCGILGGIRGLVDENKQPIVCERALEAAAASPEEALTIKQRDDVMINLVCDQIDGFAAWALAKARLAASSIVVKREAETKNSKSSHGGKRGARKG